MKPDEAPIGYWLKLLDRRIEESFDAIFAEHRLNRRHWQVLNVLRRGDDPAEALRPFWDDQERTPDEVVADLRDRGWVSDRTLSPDGEAAYTALAERVAGARTAATSGVGEDEYATTIRTLRRMVTNLEPR